MNSGPVQIPVVKRTPHYCSICGTFIPLKGWKQHSNGKKHTSFYPESLPIIGIPENANILTYQNYMKRFGKIKTFQYIKDQATIQVSYDNNYAYSKLCFAGDHTINNIVYRLRYQSSLEVPEVVPLQQTHQPREHNPNSFLVLCPMYVDKTKDTAQPQPTRKPKLPSLDSRDEFIKSIIKNIPATVPVDEALKILLGCLRPCEMKSKEIATSICADLKPILPFDAKILVYGSRFTNLHFDSSDINLYIMNLKKDSDETSAVLASLKANMEKTGKFSKVETADYRKDLFVRAVHTATEITCEISVSNMVPYYNSELLRYYFSLDSKLRDLALFLKFWFLSYDLIRKPSFMCYDLYLMIIFYFQQDDFKFPSVYELQKEAASKMQDGWQFGFNADLKYQNLLKDHSVIELFLGFMRFYTRFDYFNNCVCPFLGRMVEKVDFFDRIPEEFRILKERTQADEVNSCFLPKFGLTIQDPFEHNKCLAYIPYFAMPKVCNLWRGAWYCSVSKKKASLYKILQNCIAKVKPQAVFETKRKYQWETLRSDKIWFAKVRSMLCDVLDKVLRCQVKSEVEEFEVEDNPAITKSHIVEKHTYKCESDINVWQNHRISILKCLWGRINGRSITRLEREVAISSELVRESQQPPKMIQLQFILSFHIRPTRALISLTSMSKVLVVEHVKSYLLTMLPLWVQDLHDRPIEKATFDANEDAFSVPAEQKAWVEEELKIIAKVEESSSLVANKDEIKPQNGAEEKTSEEAETTQPENTSVEEENAENREDEDEESKVLDEILLDENFFDGLDVVDACDDEEPSAKRSKNEENDTQKDEKAVPPCDKDRSRSDDVKSTPGKRSPVERRNRRKHRPRPSPTTNRNSRELGRRSRSPRFRRPTPPRRLPLERGGKRGRSRSRSPERMRRDPEKTRRDIHRDKLKVAKDEEKKSISNRLEICKTGLVPPGMEMEQSGKRARKRSVKSPTNRDELKRYHESFLMEIREKLNEVQSQPQKSYGQQMAHQHHQEYDEQFFIGNAYVPPVQQHFPGSNPYPPQVVGHPPSYDGNYVMMQAPMPPTMEMAPAVQFEAVAAPPAQLDLNWITNPKEEKKEEKKPPENKEEIGKLFADKKISLSDFLTISAKPEVKSGSSEQLQKKIQVISKCQDVVRIINEGANFSGGLIVRGSAPMPEVKKKPGQSPLHRIPKVRFQQTSPDTALNPYTAALNSILHQAGIRVDPVVLEDGFEQNLSEKMSNNESPSALLLKASQLLQKACKKELEECVECKKRKEIKYSTIGTQVTEEDLAPPPQKKQQPAAAAPKESLVYMTPAQLMQSESNRSMNKSVGSLGGVGHLAQQQMHQRGNYFGHRPTSGPFDQPMRQPHPQQQQMDARFRNNDLFNRNNNFNQFNNWY